MMSDTLFNLMYQTKYKEYKEVYSMLCELTYKYHKTHNQMLLIKLQQLFMMMRYISDLILVDMYSKYNPTKSQIKILDKFQRKYDRDREIYININIDGEH